MCSVHIQIGLGRPQKPSKIKDKNWGQAMPVVMKWSKDMRDGYEGRHYRITVWQARKATMAQSCETLHVFEAKYKDKDKEYLFQI